MADKLDPLGWTYCEQCRELVYQFACCGNTTCNGGGCAKCDGIWDEAQERIADGRALAAVASELRSHREREKNLRELADECQELSQTTDHFEKGMVYANLANKIRSIIGEVTDAK